MLDPLFSSLDSQRELVVRWQREMTARPALGPENNGDGEAAKAEWLLLELGRLGLADIARHDCPDARVPCGYRPNLSARVPGRSARTLWVIAHMDVVPPGDERLWSAPPFELRVEGDRVYGRGVEDNQQAIVSAMLAALALLDSDLTPDLSLGLLFVADEESGMRHGLPHVLEQCGHLFSPVDLFLVPDMGNASGAMVEVAEKSCLGLRITVTGRHNRDDAPGAAVRPDTLDTLGIRDIRGIRGIRARTAAAACVLELERLYRLFRAKNPLFGPPWSTFEPSKKESGQAAVTVPPGGDGFFLDCRVLPEYDIDEVEAEARAVAGDVAARYGVAVRVDVLHKEQAPPPTPLTAPVVERLCAALERLRGVSPKVCGVGGQTLASCLRRKGLDTAVWATLVPNPHVPDECSSITAAIDDAKILLAMLFDEICGDG